MRISYTCDILSQTGLSIGISGLTELVHSRLREARTNWAVIVIVTPIVIVMPYRIAYEKTNAERDEGENND